jgi:hypothetical protein
MTRAAVLAALAAWAGCGQAGASLNGNGNGKPVAADEQEDRSPVECVPVVATASAAGTSARAAVGAGQGGPVSWLKGSTHVHTCHSGDSREQVEDVVRWYGERGYDFIVITDHNRMTEHEVNGRPLVLRGIELTHNPGSCDPPPPEADGKCRIHLNGLGLTRAPVVDGVQAMAGALDPRGRPPAIEWKNTTSNLRVDMYQAGIDKVRELGGIVQINHPNWHWGVDGELLAELGRRGSTLVEIGNMGFARWNAGDAEHPSSESVWDAALSRGALIYGVASDDAHHYKTDEIQARRADGRPVYAAGTGWVMVRAARRPDAIRAALARGDFYATTGVLLDRVDRSRGSLHVEVAEASAGEHHIAFIGQGGAQLQRTAGRRARFELARAPVGYVRAVVTRGDGARAWIQPVRVLAPTP